MAQTVGPIRRAGQAGRSRRDRTYDTGRAKHPVQNNQCETTSAEQRAQDNLRNSMLAGVDSEIRLS